MTTDHGDGHDPPPWRGRAGLPTITLHDHAASMPMPWLAPRQRRGLASIAVGRRAWPEGPDPSNAELPTSPMRMLARTRLRRARRRDRSGHSSHPVRGPEFSWRPTTPISYLETAFDIPAGRGDSRAFRMPPTPVPRGSPRSQQRIADEGGSSAWLSERPGSPSPWSRRHGSWMASRARTAAYRPARARSGARASLYPQLLRNLATRHWQAVSEQVPGRRAGSNRPAGEKCRAQSFGLSVRPAPARGKPRAPAGVSPCRQTVSIRPRNALAAPRDDRGHARTISAPSTALAARAGSWY